MPTAKESLSALFKRIANAIRAQYGTTEETDKIFPDDYPDRITAIQSGIDTSDADAVPSDIISEKTAYVDGEKITGILEEVKEGESVTPSGSQFVNQSDSHLVVEKVMGLDLAFRAGSSAKIELPMASFGTASPDDVLSGKTFTSSSGIKQIGTIATRSASDLSASGSSIIVPAGHYPSQVSKSVATVTHPQPSLSRSGGTITASHIQSEGYTSGGTTTATLSITTQSGKTVTPTTYQQTAVSSGRLTTGPVYVAGDSNLVASNIKSGVSIFGVNGNFSGGSISVLKNNLIDNNIHATENNALTVVFNNATINYPDKSIITYVNLKPRGRDYWMSLIFGNYEFEYNSYQGSIYGYLIENGPYGVSLAVFTMPSWISSNACILTSVNNYSLGTFGLFDISNSFTIYKT